MFSAIPTLLSCPTSVTRPGQFIVASVRLAATGIFGDPDVISQRVDVVLGETRGTVSRGEVQEDGFVELAALLSVWAATFSVV